MWGSYMPMQRMQKIETFNDEKGGDKQKKQESIIDNQKQDTFQFVNAWLRFWKCFINPYIFTLARNIHSKFL